MVADRGLGQSKRVGEVAAVLLETVINSPRDLGCNARLPNLDDLQIKARACNRRILDAERVGQGCVLASPAFERIAHPTADAAGGRTPALRFGDPRVMALTGALCHTLLAATGFTNKNLRVLIAGLLGSDYRAKQMTYDLRRLAPRRPDPRLPRSNRYLLTTDGIRVAIIYTKVYNRLLAPLAAADQPQAPPELRTALATITRHVDDAATRLWSRPVRVAAPLGRLSCGNAGIRAAQGSAELRRACLQRRCRPCAGTRAGRGVGRRGRPAVAVQRVPDDDEAVDDETNGRRVRPRGEAGRGLGRCRAVACRRRW